MGRLGRARAAALAGLAAASLFAACAGRVVDDGRGASAGGPAPVATAGPESPGFLPTADASPAVAATPVGPAAEPSPAHVEPNPATATIPAASTAPATRDVPTPVPALDLPAIDALLDQLTSALARDADAPLDEGRP